MLSRINNLPRSVTAQDTEENWDSIIEAVEKFNDRLSELSIASRLTQQFNGKEIDPNENLYSKEQIKQEALELLSFIKGDNVTQKSFEEFLIENPLAAKLLDAEVVPDEETSTEDDPQVKVEYKSESIGAMIKDIADSNEGKGVSKEQLAETLSTQLFDMVQEGIGQDTDKNGIITPGEVKSTELAAKSFLEAATKNLLNYEPDAELSIPDSLLQSQDKNSDNLYDIQELGAALKKLLEGNKDSSDPVKPNEAFNNSPNRDKNAGKLI